MEFDLALVPSMCDDNRNVADIECRSGDIEDRNDSRGASDANKVEATAEGYDKPNSIDWSVRDRIDFAPKPTYS